MEKKIKCSHYECNRDLYDGERCIFHSTDTDGKMGGFKKVFDAEFVRQGKEEVLYNFDGFVFPEDFSFQRKVFNMDVDFGGTLFSGKVHFTSAQFCGAAYFNRAKFYGDVDFCKAQFFGDTFFTRAQFSGAAYFTEAEFKRRIYFSEVDFNGFNRFKMIDTYFSNVYNLLEYIEKNRNNYSRPRGIKYLHEDCIPILGEVTSSRFPVLSQDIKDDVYLLSFKKKHPKEFYLWWLFADCGRSFVR